MRSLSYPLIAVLFAATLLSTDALSETVKQRLPVPNQCLDGLDEIKKQLERILASGQTKPDEQITLKYANRIVVDTLTSEGTKKPLHELIACLHKIER